MTMRTVVMFVETCSREGCDGQSVSPAPRPTWKAATDDLIAHVNIVHAPFPRLKHES